MSLKIHAERFTSINYQIIFMLITATILTVMLYKPLSYFDSLDPSPQVKSITPDLAVKWQTALKRVKTGMTVTDFIVFDTFKNEFIINVILWFEYNPKNISLEILNNYSFNNGDIKKKSEPQVTILNENLHRAHYYLQVQFMTGLNYERFPLDDHRVFLELTHNALSVEKLLYEADQKDFIMSPDIHISGFEFIHHTVKSGYSENTIGSYSVYQPLVLFSFDAAKQDNRQLLLIFLPLLFIFYLAIFAFSIKDPSIAVSLVTASISGLLAYAFVIQTLSPVVGYFMLSDYLFIFFMTSIFFIFLVSILIVIQERIGSTHYISVIRGFTILILYIALLIVWFYVTNMKGRHWPYI